MRRYMFALIIVGLAATSSRAMTVDDIIQLCQAGFTPDRIAKIVDATGLDEPLQAADWARIKREGCDDQLVDALLEVLVPVDNETDNSTAGSTSEARHDNVNVYLSGGWGWNGWYNGFGYGGYDPFWSVGWSYWDPYWGWSWWDSPGYWYGDMWWGRQYHNHFCNAPYYFHGGDYEGGYYSSGHYARYKASRRSSWHGSDYAQSKVYEQTQGNLGVYAGSKATRGGMTLASFPVLTPKSSSSVGTRGIGTKSTVPTGRAYTTKNNVYERSGTSSRTTLRPKSGTSTTSAGRTQTPTRYGTLKTKDTSRGTAPAGSGQGRSVARPKSGEAHSTPRYEPSPKSEGRWQSGREGQRSGQGNSGGSRARSKR